MFYEITELSNGATVISEHMPSMRSIALGLWFNVGSRDEKANQAGLTHFMEHMMFKGTPTRSVSQISEHFDRLGADLNAFTSKECTCYYSRFVDDKLENAFEVLADMVKNSLFAQDAIDTEREVVIEEIARSEDSPDDYVFELFSRNFMEGHELGLPVLGTRERVGSYLHADCAAFHAEHYHAGNLVVAAAGNVEHAKLVELAETYLKDMKPGTKAKRKLAVPSYESGLRAVKRETEQAHVVIGFPWMPSGDERVWAGNILTSLMGGSMSSRLFQEVREKRGLVYSIHAFTSAYQGAGMWGVYAGARPDNLKEVLNITREQINQVCEEAVSEEELTRNIDLASGQLPLSLESTYSHMTRLGRRETLDLPHYTIDHHLEQLRAVDAVAVQALAKQYLSTQPLIAVVSPFSEDEVAQLV